MSAAFKGRREDLRLVTGQGKYTSDWNLPGQLYAYFLRSDRAHAEIVSMATAQASKSAGVVAILELHAEEPRQEELAEVLLVGREGLVERRARGCFIHRSFPSRPAPSRRGYWPP